MTKRAETFSIDLDAVAAQWIARRDRGLTAAEENELARWLSAPGNAEAFARSEAVWGALPSLDRLPAGELDALMAPRRRRLAPVVWLAGTAAAAAAVALFVLLQIPAARPRGEAVVQTHAAPADAEARVALPDGSVAVLQRGSRIAFGEFTSARRVRLLAGEAHFTVAKSSALPFFVHAGRVTVRDIGTAFDVRLEPDRVAVLVTEGRVAVATENAGPQTARVSGETSAPPSTAVAPPHPEKILEVGEQLIVETAFRPGDAKIAEATTPDMAAALAWKSRRLEFDRTPLAAAVRELNRYNVSQLAVADDSTGSLLVSGGVQSDNLDAFVGLLESGFGVSVESRGREIVLRRVK